MFSNSDQKLAPPPKQSDEIAERARIIKQYFDSKLSKDHDGTYSHGYITGLFALLRGSIISHDLDWTTSKAIYDAIVKEVGLQPSQLTGRSGSDYLHGITEEQLNRLIDAVAKRTEYPIINDAAYLEKEKLKPAKRNATYLAQAKRTGHKLFSSLPDELLAKIAGYSSGNPKAEDEAAKVITKITTPSPAAKNAATSPT